MAALFLFWKIKVILVLVETLSGLASEQACANHLAEQRVRTVFGVAELVVKHFHNGEVDIVADKVGQCKRSHRMVCP